MIVWLEDRPGTVGLYCQALRDARMKFHMFGTIAEVFELLNDDIEPKGLTFILDIMLYGVHDLSSIGISNAPTVSGNRAGQVFAERYLRVAGSRFRSCPIIFLTERKIDDALTTEVKALASSSGAPVDLFQKFSQSQLEAFLQLMHSRSGKSSSAG